MLSGVIQPVMAHVRVLVSGRISCETKRMLFFA